MNKLILPVVLILLAGVVAYYGAGSIISGSSNFFSNLVLKESGKGISALRAEEKRLNEALGNARELKQRAEDLTKEMNELPQEKVERLEKFLPDTVDTIEVVVTLNNIAKKHGMAVKKVKIVEEGEKNLARDESATTFSSAVSRSQNIGELGVGFSVQGPYYSFLAFLSDLADSLRLVDLETLSFSSPEKGFSEYDVQLKTYWVK